MVTARAAAETEARFDHDGSHSDDYFDYGLRTIWIADYRLKYQRHQVILTDFSPIVPFLITAHAYLTSAAQ